MRIIIQFGKKRLYTGLVFSIHHNKPEAYETKPVLSIIDAFPVVNSHQLRLWEWTADYYLCSIGEVYKAAMPTGLRLESETRVISAGLQIDNQVLTLEEQWMLEVLNKQESLTIAEMAKQSTIENPLPVLKKLMEKGVVLIQEEVREKYREKTQKVIGLHSLITSAEAIHQTLDLLNRAKKQAELFRFFLEELNEDYFSGLTVPRDDLLEKTGVGTGVLKGLIEKQILEEKAVVVSRLDEDSLLVSEKKGLNEYQLEAHQQIKDQFTKTDVVLLHGVTSSGKTEIYIHLIEEALQNQQQVLYLLPEIALTSQIIRRLKSVFGNKVGVYHSKFSDAERVEIWNKVMDDGPNAYQVILGVRSSIFLPFNRLGLIIVDEEHENTYKQFDPAPRYNARDLSVVLAKFHLAKVLLGTATPSLESYYNAKTGRYGLVQLDQRHLNITLPKILLADVRKAYKKKQMRSHFTPMLLDNIEEALVNKEQVILFQNRRGYSPYLECGSCGWIPKCRQCDVNLTYHKGINKLICHYCGYSIEGVYRCGHCNEPHMETKGFGTEKIEDEIALIFPDAVVSRLDLDSTRGRYNHETIIDDFQHQHIDILIGTQMVTKGLDFDHVSVVGILNADNLLQFPDFRAHERSYQLMAQVSGRAGRKSKQGKVVIQTSDTEHPVIHQVMRNDYMQLFVHQMEERKRFFYPPYSRLIKLTLKHREKHIVEQAGIRLAQFMKQIEYCKVLGPTSPIVNMIQNLHIRQILLKLPRGKNLSLTKSEILKGTQNLILLPEFKAVQVVIDVDPM